MEEISLQKEKRNLTFGKNEYPPKEVEVHALNRVTAVIDPLGNKTLYEYNALGLLAKAIDALGNVTTYEYDEMGRLVKATDPVGAVQAFEYDQNGNLIKEVDPEGYATVYQYDALNRLFEKEDALKQKVAYAYDPKGNLIQITDPKGAIYRYEYDELDRLSKEINHLGNVQSYTYDPNGNLKAKIDFNGQRTSYTYDKLNRLVEISYADGKKNAFSYDANGQMTAAVNENSTQRYYYDQLSRLKKVEIESEYDRYTVEYEYNKVGQRTKVILNDGNILQNRVTKYQYDEAMRLSQVELHDGEVVKYEYDALNRVVRQLNSNRTGTNYTYTPDGKIERIEHYEGLNGYGRTVQSYGYVYNTRGQRILEVEGTGQVTAYQYDPVGRLTKVYYPFSGGKKESNRIERVHYFGLEANLDNHQEYYRMKHNPDEYIAKLLYDYRNKLEDLHRLIQENGRPLDLYNNGYYIEEYRYDPAGNIIFEGNAWGTIEFEYDAANQLIKAGARTYSYDANGNLIREGYRGDYVEYSYDYENRLISARNLTRNDKLFGGEHPFTGTITYTYDALGRKIGKETAPANINRVMVSGYYYDGLSTDILAEYENEIWDLQQYRQSKKHTAGQIPGGQVNYFNEYYYGNGLIAFTNMDHPNPWYQQRDINFYHKDALGSIVAITDRYGNVVERYKYDAYGNPYEGRFLHMSKNNPYGFTGQRFEAELRVYSFAFRDYNPQSMRWMTVDPIKDGLNWYQYCGSDPVNFWDPLGLEEYNLIIFYYNTETDPDESFRRAAITNARETEAKDYFLSVTTETDFKEGWTRTKEIFERRGDEVANISIFTHGGIGRLYFVPDSKNDGTLTYSEIEKLPQLPYKDDAEITIHACNSGVGQYSTAQAFANSQQIPAYGTQTYTNFSEKYEVFDRIDRNSENVYLEAYDKNFIFGGELIPKVKFYPEVNNDDLCD